MDTPSSQFSIPPAILIYHHHLTEAAKAREQGRKPLISHHESEAKKAAEELARQGYELAPPVRPT